MEGDRKPPIRGPFEIVRAVVRSCCAYAKLRKEFFAKLRGTYCTSHNRSLPGSEARRQLDLFMKRNDSSSASTHNWKDVHVIGELKEGSTNDNDLLLQLARYAREVFACQPTRRFVHGFTPGYQAVLGSSHTNEAAL